MKTQIKDLLPVGSVIRLKKGTKNLVIIGIKQTDLITGETYDYVTIPYPEGYISKEAVFYVQHDKIDEVVFKGYSNKEREEFIEAVENYYKEHPEK